METTHGKTHSENGEGECWWSRIASPYPDANNVAPIIFSIILFPSQECFFSSIFFFRALVPRVRAASCVRV
jgi:hypothetical protein